MFANSEKILDAVAVFKSANPVNKAPALYQAFTEDHGVVNGNRLVVGRDVIAAKTRQADCGEDRIFDDEFGMGYELRPQTCYQAMRKCRADLTSDNTGEVASAIMSWLQTSQARMYDEVIHKDLIANTRPGIDGVPLFSASHPIIGAGTTASNVVASALSGPTLASADSLMSGFLDDAGDATDITGTHLFVAPNLKTTALSLINASTRLQGVNATGTLDPATGIVAAAAVSNVYEGLYTLVVDKRLPSDAWFLADLSNGGFWHLGHTPEGFEVVITDRNSYVEMHRGMREWLMEERLFQGPGEWRRVAGNIAGTV